MTDMDLQSSNYESHAVESGTLYIVPTPIGNLGDISQRAIDVLANVDWVAAEDTRHSKRLFDHLGLRVRSLSLHQHNESQRSELLCNHLRNGQSVALVSDAGTPLISDPGYVLVQHCREQGVPVTALPGPCAAITALSASGLPTDKFQFVGFLPVKQQALNEAVKALAAAPLTSVCYESPRRVTATLNALAEHCAKGQQIVLAKELTKAFESYVSGDAETILTWFEEDERRLKGEFVLMIAPAPDTDQAISPEALALLQALGGLLPPKKAAAVVAQHYGLKKNSLYKLLITDN
ncbi:16S rRNA (cytidine(1402)-2'-O)-methyltransferase [Alteromonas sp. ASW11-36]|uniref:Ribosomal RNA small subunit methyltransferase I n=1 Tax=Alteromonas arenosi TaxID=3055817 RepID=A0ABT7SV99_9ALTE|nr:16S rRNA (cytidine(1402)-2'-O)-methyltransferase [Alteromonas sp. ASW11-36]MDM7859472.1 16S rRNA (cytidine(1402)-2'-O)-methyltransferase [Alteromonas sp. ASW11-36]